MPAGTGGGEDGAEEFARPLPAKLRARMAEHGGGGGVGGGDAVADRVEGEDAGFGPFQKVGDGVERDGAPEEGFRGHSAACVRSRPHRITSFRNSPEPTARNFDEIGEFSLPGPRAPH